MNIAPGILTDRVGRARAGVLERWNIPAVRNGYALVASTLVTSALGAIYWVIAARRYSAADVGIQASLVSAMWFLTNLSHLNLTNVLNRFVPTAGPKARHLIVVAYRTALGLSMLAATIFILGVRWWADELSDVREYPWYGIAFVIATAVWAIFVLQDSVLAGLQEGTTVFIENTVYGVAKIVLLFAFASVAPGTGIFLSWVAPLPFLVIAVNLLVFGKFLRRHAHTTLEELPSRRAFARFVAADYSSGLLWMASTSLLPVLVLQVEGADASAYVFTAFTIAYTLYLVSRSMGVANTTAGAREPHLLATTTRRTMRETARIIIPAVAFILVFAPWILLVFGEDYSEGGTTLLRLFTLSAIPYLVTSTFVSVSYVQRRMRAVIATTGSMAVSTLVLSVSLLLAFGVNGVGIGWLLAQTAVATVLLCTEFRSLWVSRVDVRRLEPVVAGARALSARRRAPGVRDRATRVVAGDDRLRGWSVEHVMPSEHDVDIVALRGEDDRRALLRVPVSPSGVRAVAGHTGALLQLRERDIAALRPLVPEVLAENLCGPAPWMLESRLPGSPASTFLDALGTERCLGMVGTVVEPLHAHALRRMVVDDATLNAWVDRPIEQIRNQPGPALYRHRDEIALQRLREELHGELHGREVAAGFVHGDLWLGNVLVDPETHEVCGVIDWDFAREPVLVHTDVMHLILATRSAREKMELGDVVVRLLATDSWEDYELAALERTGGLGACDVSPRTLLLMTWLGHVSGLPDKSDRYKKSLVWRARNTEQVLERL
jgi:O-antigen/teichoic acid export membrane protein/Ser/Thr protein kinase RdoA (MazF antagonist)